MTIFHSITNNILFLISDIIHRSSCNEIKIIIQIKMPQNLNRKVFGLRTHELAVNELEFLLVESSLIPLFISPQEKRKFSIKKEPFNVMFRTCAFCAMLFSFWDKKTPAVASGYKSSDFKFQSLFDITKWH